MKFFITFFCLILNLTIRAQSCTTPGQTPSSAFPVCGTTTFHQTKVPICTSHNLSVPGCNGDGAAYQDKNPFWYKFTCYQSGSLAFLITPNDLGDDYDWQLYDITNHDPNDVFTDPSLIVTGNWAGTYGKTGASPTGVPYIQCASVPTDNKSPFSSMPSLITGHTYLLLISHFTDSQSGYSLSFGGGTAVITDPTVPALSSAQVSCSGDIIRIKMNKHILCASIDVDGSDFYVMPGNIPAVSASGTTCSGSFDTDSMEIRLGSILPSGNYHLKIQAGNDGNTLKDNCDNQVQPGDSAAFTVLAHIPTPLDSLEPVKCSPRLLKLYFKKLIDCSSIAADGTDFSVTGPYPVTITGATGNCSTGNLTREVIINFNSELQVQGNFTVTLKSGSDGNTLIDECGLETPAGSNLSFNIKDTVNAGFSYSIYYGCTTDTIKFFHLGSNGVNSWLWDLDESQFSSLPDPIGLYRDFKLKNINLLVSNGFCSDSSNQKILLDNFLKADFSAYDDNCPNEPLPFTNASVGKIASFTWSFGDGNSSTEVNPSHIYLAPGITKQFIVSLTTLDSFGCTNTFQKPIKVYSSCYLAVPSAFTPNNDGLNDLLHPLNAIKAEQLDFKVYNRWGQLVFETHDWKHGWDGTFSGKPQASGVYVWFLEYVDRDTKQHRMMKGTAALIR